ncbi:MAG TPA: hypothetical protein VFP84_11135, partial [Kofleriaceae bacterium]|nr:hypothetical protein [Kofleriaceae bacterium]
MHTTALTGIDTLAGILVAIILVISALTLLGMGIMMAVGAMFSNRPLVTSMPEIQQAQFQSFEQRNASSGRTAWAASLVGSLVLLVVIVGIFFGVEPEKKNLAKDMNMSNLTKKRVASPTKSETAPAEAPRPDTAAPAEAPKPDTPA